MKNIGYHDLVYACNDFKRLLSDQFAPSTVQQFVNHVMENSRSRVFSISSFAKELEASPEPPDQLLGASLSGRSSLLFQEQGRSPPKATLAEIEGAWIDDDFLEEVDSPQIHVIISNLASEVGFMEIGEFFRNLSSNISVKSVRFCFFKSRRSAVIGFSHLDWSERFFDSSKKKEKLFQHVFGPDFYVRFVRNKPEVLPSSSLTERKLVSELIESGRSKKKKDGLSFYSHAFVAVIIRDLPIKTSSSELGDFVHNQGVTPVACRVGNLKGEALGLVQLSSIENAESLCFAILRSSETSMRPQIHSASNQTRTPNTKSPISSFFFPRTEDDKLSELQKRLQEALIKAASSEKTRQSDHHHKKDARASNKDQKRGDSRSSESSYHEARQKSYQKLENSPKHHRTERESSKPPAYHKRSHRHYSDSERSRDHNDDVPGDRRSSRYANNAKSLGRDYRKPSPPREKDSHKRSNYRKRSYDSGLDRRRH